jgi:enoyl-CoA hydratase/carnithine racemase
MAGVLIEKTEERWTITLNAPDRLNALGKTVVSDLLEAARDVGNEKTVRAVVLKGSGKGFCAGADLKERNGMTEEEVRSFVSLLNETFNYISQSPKVWISAIHGFCLGGGLELALCTDIRIAHKDTNVGLPEVRRGILPGAGGTQRLPRLIGMAKAKSLILTGRTVKADEGEKLGLFNEISDDLDALADRWASEICKCAPISLTQAKRALEGGWDLSLNEGLCLERACYEVIIPTEDRLEGLKAFAEKREPKFKGQ